MRKIHWLQLTTEDFAGLDPEKTVVVLPMHPAIEVAKQAAVQSSGSTPSRRVASQVFQR